MPQIKGEFLNVGWFFFMVELGSGQYQPGSETMTTKCIKKNPTLQLR